MCNSETIVRMREPCGRLCWFSCSWIKQQKFELSWQMTNFDHWMAILASRCLSVNSCRWMSDVCIAKFSDSIHSKKLLCDKKNLSMQQQDIIISAIFPVFHCGSRRLHQMSSVYGMDGLVVVGSCLTGDLSCIDRTFDYLKYQQPSLLNILLFLSNCYIERSMNAFSPLK